jgi:hypothetical protein
MNEKIKKRTTRITEVVEEFDASTEPEAEPEGERVCALEGCEVSLEGMKANAKFCCRAHWQKVHNAKPERKTTKLEYSRRPETKVLKTANETARYHADPVGYTAYRRWVSAKHHAKDKGLPFDITQEEVRVLIEEALVDGCAVTRQPIRLYAPGENDGKPQLDAFSLDRVEPPLGYVRGNVRGVCWSYNRTKHDMTVALMRLEVALTGANPYALGTTQGDTFHKLGKTIDRRARAALLIPTTINT